MAASNPVQCGIPSAPRQTALVPEVVPRAIPDVIAAPSGTPPLMVNDPVVAARRQDNKHKVIKLKMPKKKPLKPTGLDYANASSGDDGSHPVPDVPMGGISEPSSQVPVGLTAPESQPKCWSSGFGTYVFYVLLKSHGLSCDVPNHQSDTVSFVV